MKMNRNVAAIAVALVAAVCMVAMYVPDVGVILAGVVSHVGQLAGSGVGLLAAAPFATPLARKDDGGGSGSGSEPSIADVGRKLSEVIANVKTFGEDISRKMQVGETVTQELKQKADENLTQMTELSARLAELEQKAAREAGAGGNGGVQQKTIGQLVVEDDAMKDMDSSSRKSVRVRFSRKDMLNVPATVGAGVSPGNSLVPGDRQPGIIAPPQRKMTIRNLLLPGETSQNSVEYTVETGFTNNAAPTAEGAQKPKSDITFNLKNAPVRTIPHLFKASRQLLDDAPGLMSYIDGRARYGLQLVEENQLLMGNGVGQNILGIVPQASAYAAPITVAGATRIDTIRLAILQAVLAEYPASGIVLNPMDWAGIELTKDSQGRYIIAQPQESATPRMWGLPVVETQAMAADNFLVGAFNMAAQIFDRMEIEVLISTENADDFEKNMVTIRAEERLALCVYRPEAFVTGEFTP